MYEELEGSRWTYLDRARSASRLTLPYLITEESFGPHSRIETPFQGIGARGVNNLASKLLLALLPANTPFFRLNVDKYKMSSEGTNEQAITDIETALQRVEESVMDEISRESYRVALHECLKHLIVAGNALIYLPDEGGMRVFHLDRYVVCRDPMGNVEKIATKETLSYMTLPENVKQALGFQPGDNSYDNKSEVNLYTSVCRHGNKWEVFQDVNGVRIEGSEGTYDLDKCPFIALRFSRIDGEDYGRSYIEDFLGDLQSLETLTQAIVEGSASAAKVLFMVNPNGTTRARNLAESPNGAIVQGTSSDVSVLQVNKFNDFRVAQETINTIKDRLGHAFLLTSGVIRNAERVTAAEVNMLAQELESALGGLYSLLSSELQLPLVQRLMVVMGKKRKLPKLPKDLVNPVIITGVEALGRGHDLQKLDMFLAGASQVVGPEAVSQYVNIGEYFKRRATSLGIKTTQLIKSEEELQQERAQAQQYEMAKTAAPAGVKAVSDQLKQQPIDAEE